MSRIKSSFYGFGTFIALLRRRDGLTIEVLAARAEVKSGELCDIEADESPEPSIVHQLAGVFHLPPKKLLLRAVMWEPRAAVIREDAARPAAHSAGALSPAEHELLDALVREIGEAE